MIPEDHCIYTKYSTSYFVILSLCIDDILLAKNNVGYIIFIKDWLSSNFEMNDMSEANFILCMKVQHNCLKRILFLSHESYINMILKRFNMATYKFLDTPIAKSENFKMSKVPYLSAVGT